MKKLLLWARWLKRDVMTLWFAFRNAGAPWYTRVLTVLLTVYVVSPIDLLPDFIPVVGYLDDLIVVPVGVWALIRLLPDKVLLECRAQTDRRMAEQEATPRSIASMLIVAGLWVVIGWALYQLLIA